MKKIFITLITSMFILFIVWTFVIAIKNNFNIANIRFNLKATIDQLNAQQEANFEELIKNIQASLTRYELVQNTAQDNWIMQQINNMYWLGTAGQIFYELIKYMIGITKLILNLIAFVFNPITY